MIKNKDHQRNRSKTVDQLKHKVIQAFVNSEAINVYIDELYKKYPRYMRDQLQVMIDVIHSWPNAIDEALHTCLDKSIFSANDFRDITQYISRPKVSVDLSNVNQHVESKKHSVSPTVRDIDEYLTVLKGVIS